MRRAPTTIAIAMAACTSIPTAADDDDTEGPAATGAGNTTAAGTTGDPDPDPDDPDDTFGTGSTGDDPDAGSWSSFAIPVVAGETVTDVVAGDDAVWIAVSSVQGVRVLTRAVEGPDDAPWEVRFEQFDGLPADLERATTAGVWFSGGRQFVHIDLQGATVAATLDGSIAAPTGTAVSPARVVGFGHSPYGFAGFAAVLEGPGTSPYLQTSAPVLAAVDTGDGLLVGNQWGIAVLDPNEEGAERIAWPCGRLRDFHRSDDEVHAASEDGVIATLADGRWSFAPVGGTRVWDLDARDDTAWFAGDAIGVRLDGTWARLDEPDGPANGRALSLGPDDALWVVAGERDLWWRRPGAPQTADFAVADVALSLDGEGIATHPAWIGRDGDRLVVQVPFDGPGGAARLLSVEYGLTTGYAHGASIADGVADELWLPSLQVSAQTDLDGRISEGSASTPGSPGAPALSLSFYGPFPDA